MANLTKHNSAFSGDFADSFDKYRSLNGEILASWISKVLHFVNTQKSDCKTILDVGAGTGRFSIPIAMNVAGFGYSVFSLEQSSDMLMALIQKIDIFNVSNVIPVLGDFHSQTFDKPFAGIFASEVLHLLGDVNKTCLMFNQIIERDGWVIIRCTSHNQLKKRTWMNYFPNLLKRELKRTIDLYDLQNALMQAGFSNITTTEINGSYQMASKDYLKMFRSKAYSGLYLCSPEELSIGYKAIEQYCEKNRYCNHVMDFTCVSAVKSVQKS